jgi:NADPH-dependent 2,4-dienoyl-CoA reductase/sulfur reductase-like enzyme
MPSDRVVVIGAGPAGLEAARLAAELGSPVTLIEKMDVAGGMPIHADYAALTHHFRPAADAMGEMVDAASGNDLIDLRVGTEVASVDGRLGEFTVALPARSSWRPDSNTSIRAGKPSSTSTTNSRMSSPSPTRRRC